MYGTFPKSSSPSQADCFADWYEGCSKMGVQSDMLKQLAKVNVESNGVQFLPVREVSLTPSEQPPPRSPREEEEFLDWSENQRRPRRSLLGLDLGVLVLLLAVTVLLVIGLVEFFRHVHR